MSEPIQTAFVALTRTDAYDYDRILAALNEQAAALGITSGHFSGKRVVIKPNLVAPARTVPRQRILFFCALSSNFCAVTAHRISCWQKARVDRTRKRRCAPITERVGFWMQRRNAVLL